MIQFKNEHLTVFESALYMTTSAVIESEDVVVMTDPNWLPHEVENIRDYIKKNIDNRQLYIIYTHSDFDHIIGSGAFPEAKVIASEPFIQNPDKKVIVQEIHRFDQGYYLQRNYPIEYPEADVVVTKDGQKLQLGSLTLTFYLAPGHTKDSLFTVVEPYGIFLAGDYLSDVEFPFITSGYKEYVNTMKKAQLILDKHNITTLIPGHGTTTVDKNEMKRRLQTSQFYLEQLVHDQGELEQFLRKEYAFYDGMKDSHEDNRELAKRKL